MDLKDAVDRANDILKDVKECSFTSITEDGYPHTATRSFCRPAGIDGCYISTNTSGNLSQSIRQNNKASLCVQINGSNITLVGDAKIVEDKKIKQKLWLDWFINHYPKGIDDPEYCIVEFKTKRVSLWIDRQVVKFEVQQ